MQPCVHRDRFDNLLMLGRSFTYFIGYPLLSWVPRYAAKVYVCYPHHLGKSALLMNDDMKPDTVLGIKWSTALGPLFRFPVYLVVEVEVYSLG